MFSRRATDGFKFCLRWRVKNDFYENIASFFA